MGPIPGGLGPQSPVKFVQPSGPFADATGGHFLWPLVQVRIERVEKITQPDHYSRLFFGRSTTVVQIRQPFFLWQPVPRIDDPQVIDWRADHNLNRYRTTFQTVGQPYWIFKEPIRPEFSEVIGQPDHNGLHRYRTVFQTVGQSFSLWPKYQQPAFDAEVISSPKTDLYPYRQFSTAAVIGQPFWIFQQTKVSLDAETINQPEHSLHRFRTTYQTVGQPWNTWQAYKQPDFEPEKITSPQYDLYPYRQITITAGPGQPWYLWPPIQITITPEEQMFRENHDLSLYPFRPHDAIVPVPDVIPPIGDGGRSPYRGFDLKSWKKKQKPLRDLEDDIEALYKEITSPPLARQAEKVVKPFVPVKLRDDIKPSNIEWDKVVQSIRAIEKLHALYEQEIRDDDDDIEEFISLL